MPLLCSCGEKLFLSRIRAQERAVSETLNSLIPSAEEKPALERHRAAKPKEQKPQEKPAEQPEAETPGPSHPPKGKAKGGKGKQQPGIPAQEKSPTTSPPTNKGTCIFQQALRTLISLIFINTGCDSAAWLQAWVAGRAGLIGVFYLPGFGLAHLPASRAPMSPTSNCYI